MEARRNPERRHASQLRRNRGLHGLTETSGRVHDHVDMERTPHSRTIFLLGFQLVQCLLDAPPGLVVNTAALMQHAIPRGFTDPCLSGDLLDRKMLGTSQHKNYGTWKVESRTEVFLRSFWAFLRFLQC